MLLVSSRRWKNVDFFGGGVWSVFNRSPKMPQCAVWSGPHWPGQGSVSRDTAQRRGGSGLLGSLSLDSRFKMFSCVPPPSTPQAGGCGWDAARPGVQAGKVGREAAGDPEEPDPETRTQAPTWSQRGICESGRPERPR